MLEDENINMDENIIVDESDEEITQDSETSSSLSDELKDLKDTSFKSLKEEIYNISLKTKTPYNFILEIDGKLKSAIKLIDKDKSIINNYDFFLKKNHKIYPQDFLIIFYIANKKKSKEYLIDNFNKFRDISGESKYYIQSFNTYKYNFEEKYNQYYKNTLEKK